MYNEFQLLDCVALHLRGFERRSVKTSAVTQDSTCILHIGPGVNSTICKSYSKCLSFLEVLRFARHS